LIITKETFSQDIEYDIFLSVQNILTLKMIDCTNIRSVLRFEFNKDKYEVLFIQIFQFIQNNIFKEKFHYNQKIDYFIF
jgi:hypothetical protein